jgi:hypothetical protein
MEFICLGYCASEFGPTDFAGELVKLNFEFFGYCFQSCRELFLSDGPFTLGLYFFKYQVDVSACQIFVQELTVFGKFGKGLSIHFISFSNP